MIINALGKTGESFDKVFMKFLAWRERHIKEKTFVSILALAVGILGGVAALMLKGLIHFISGFLTSHFSVSSGNYLYLLYPLIGILITTLFVKYVVRDNISHGVTRVLYALSQNKSRLKRHNMWTSVVASSITIGFGGSVGAEGPIVYTGAAIGSNLGRVFRMSPRILMILVGCGAAAGIAGIFKAPIAGMLFTLEVLMIDLTTVSVMPLLIASITAATLSYVFTGYDVEFFFVQSEPFQTWKIPYVIIMGVFLGFVSLYFTRSMNMMEKVFRSFHSRWRKIGLGGTVLAFLVFLLPPLYGEGYGAITHLLGDNAGTIVNNSIFYADRDNVWWVMGVIGALVLLKPFATSATNGGGGVGGTFAPSLFVGCMAGYLFAYGCNNLMGLDLPCRNFALMGMAGVMSGVMHAPLMGIFLTAELTGGYDLFLPLLIASTISYGTIKIFEPYSIYTMRLAREGKLLTHHKDRAVLTLLKMGNVIETDFVSVRPDMNLREMCGAISRSSRNLFPVIDDKGRLMGVVLLDEIRNIMFRPDLYKKFYVNQFMSAPPARVQSDASMEEVMKTFDDTGAWNLPVVEPDGSYVGFVSKSKIFNSYRRVLRHYSED